MALSCFLAVPFWRNHVQRQVAAEIERCGGTVGVRYDGPLWLFRIASDDCRAKYDEASAQPALLPPSLRDVTGAIGFDAYIKSRDVADSVSLGENHGARNDLAAALVLLPRLSTIRLVSVTREDSLPGEKANWNALAGLPNLQLVVLKSGSSVDDILTGLRDCTSLRGIHVHPNAFDEGGQVRWDILASDAGVLNFGRLKHLQELKIHGSGVTSASIPTLRALTELQHLDLGATRVSEQEIWDLKDALPGLVTHLDVKRPCDGSLENYGWNSFDRKLSSGSGGMF
jgi:hypothetical protein